MISSYILFGFLLLLSFENSFQQCNQTPGIFFNGNDLPNGQSFVNSIGECCLRCAASTSCQAYSVLLSSGRYLCYLKYAIGSNLISNSLATSGVKQQSVPTFVPPILPTTTPSPTTMSTAMTTTIATTTSTAGTTTRASVCIPSIDSNFPGNDLPGQGYGNVASYLDCCNICGSNPLCTAFSYSVVDRYCWLKNPPLASGSYNGQIDPYPNYVSGSLVGRK